jgi:hypothetical protein
MKKTTCSLSVLIVTQIIWFSAISGQQAPGSKEAASDIRLSGLQMNVTRDIGKNKEQILQGIAEASAAGVLFLHAESISSLEAATNGGAIYCSLYKFR